MSDDVDQGPILELDEETARDTAAPIDTGPPVIKYTPQQMWEHQADKVANLQASAAAWLKAGGTVFNHEKREREIQIEMQIANVIAFVIDNESDIRAFVKTLNAERSEKDATDKARRKSFAVKRAQEGKRA